MSKAVKKVGRPITAIHAAQAQYQSLKSKRDAAANGFTKVEDYCIKQVLLQKVENLRRADTGPSP